MELNHAVARDGGEVLRHELQDVGHDPQVRVERPQCLLRFRGLERLQLIDGDAALLCGYAQRIGGRAGLLRGTEYAGDAIASVHERLQRRLAEVTLSHDGNSHPDIPPNWSV